MGAPVAPEVVGAKLMSGAIHSILVWLLKLFPTQQPHAQQERGSIFYIFPARRPQRRAAAAGGSPEQRRHAVVCQEAGAPLVVGAVDGGDAVHELQAQRPGLPRGLPAAAAVVQERRPQAQRHLRHLRPRARHRCYSPVARPPSGCCCCSGTTPTGAATPAPPAHPRARRR